jgi:hypothetical protein
MGENQQHTYVSSDSSSASVSVTINESLSIHVMAALRDLQDKKIVSRFTSTHYSP